MRTQYSRAVVTPALSVLVAIAAGCASDSISDNAVSTAAEIGEGDVVRIVSVSSGKVLDVAGASVADGALVQQWGDAQAKNQAWSVRREATGHVRFVSVASGRCLDLAGGSAADGARIQQWACADQDNQRWTPQAIEGGAFTLVNAQSAKCADVSGASLEDGAPLQQWSCVGTRNQQFRLDILQSGDANDGLAESLVGTPLAIVSASSGKVVDVVGASAVDGAPIQQWSDADGANQRWSIQRGPSGAYVVVNALDGKCLDAADGSNSDGALVQQWGCSGAANQTWRFQRSTGGTYAIVSLASGRCLDVAGARGDDGAPIVAWSCTGSSNQAWLLRPGGSTTPPRPLASASSLRAAADAAGKWIGVAVSPSRFGDAAYAATATSEFNYVTPENEMKWDATEPMPGQFQFDGGDAVASFAEQHRMRVKGHALVWHSQLPAWVSALTDPAAVRAAMLRHVTTVATHYRGKVAAWDVVNEAIDDTPGHAIRDDVFHHALGEGYIAEAFRAAHEADPSALLFYNDYGIEGLDGKADAMYALVQRLVQAGVPISGVGLQTHIGTNDGASAADIAANMHRVAALGLLVNVSELDVNACAAAGSPAAKLALQETRFHDVVAACMTEARCHAVTLWGLADKDSWLNAFAPCSNGQSGSPWPLAFDDVYGRKPAWQGIARALQGR